MHSHAGKIDVSCWMVDVSGSDELICCVAIVEIPVFNTTSGSCDVAGKGDDGVFDVMEDIYSSVTLYVVPIE